MTTEYMNQEHWRFMLGDLRAAEWVVRIDSEMDAASLGRKFLSIHQFFLRNIGRERPELFKGIDRRFLVAVVRQWIHLYRATLAALRNRYPCVPGSKELALAGVNWSRGLGISYEGILEGISYSSRYAEFWAEMSLRDEDCYHSFQDRMNFVGGEAYWKFLELGNSKKLAVIDGLDNSATPFDMIAAASKAAVDAPLSDVFAQRGWRTLALESEAIEVIRVYAAAA